MQRYGDTAWSTSQWARIRGDDELRLALTISHPMNVMRRAPQDRPEVACAESGVYSSRKTDMCSQRRKINTDSVPLP